MQITPSSSTSGGLAGSGVGLAAAIALAATIVRGLARPAAPMLLGDRGLAPARASGKRVRGWDHGVSVVPIGSTND